MLAKLERNHLCKWQTNMISLDVDGNVDLCCRTYNQSLGVNFMETSSKEILSMKLKNDFCSKTMRHKWHQIDEAIEHFV